jgi:hypothetical protein
MSCGNFVINSYSRSVGAVITLSVIDAQGLTFKGLLKASIKQLPKLISHPQQSFKEINTERVNYFRTITQAFIN